MCRLSESSRTTATFRGGEAVGVGRSVMGSRWGRHGGTVDRARKLAQTGVVAVDHATPAAHDAGRNRRPSISETSAAVVIETTVPPGSPTPPGRWNRVRLDTPTTWRSSRSVSSSRRPPSASEALGVEPHGQGIEQHLGGHGRGESAEGWHCRGRTVIRCAAPGRRSGRSCATAPTRPGSRAARGRRPAGRGRRRCRDRRRRRG